jgi:FKBP-type peptidyl-prolyl cis-trans isomerase
MRVLSPGIDDPNVLETCMRKSLILPAVLLVAAAAVADAQQTAKPAQKPAAQPAKPAAQPAAPAPASGQQAGKPESVPDRASYVIGFNLGRTLKQNDVQANTDLIIKGVRDGLAGSTGMLTDAEMQSTMQEFQKQVQAQQEAKQKVIGDKNKTEGEAFLAKNKARAGVKTTASGLQYEVEKEGTGPAPKATDTVTVNYKGTLMDGTTFDSSYDRGQPATFVLNQVIPGWTEGVQLMKVGSKYKFYIPAALGYGDKGAGNVIGPNSPLVFEVELLSIGEPKPAPGAPAGAEAQPQTPPPSEKPPGR